MIRHRRLIEALGLAVILIAWTLNWWNADRWAGAAADFQFYVESILDEHRASALTTTVLVESAVSRSAAVVQPTASRTLEHYAAAWTSREVRWRWSQHAQAQLQYLRNSHENLSNIRADHGLKNDHRLELLSARIDSIHATLLLGSVREDVHGQQLLVPDPRVLSECRATGLDRRMERADSEWIWPVRYQTLADLRARPRELSLRYLVLFLSGSLLVAVAKAADWRAGG